MIRSMCWICSSGISWRVLSVLEKKRGCERCAIWMLLPYRLPRSVRKSSPQNGRMNRSERLHEALRRHDVFVDESTRWGDPRAKLLTGEHWERVRPTVCQSLGRKAEPKMELDELASRLDAAYRYTAARFPQPGVRIEKVK